MLGPVKALEIPGFIGCLDFSVYLNLRFYNIVLSILSYDECFVSNINLSTGFVFWSKCYTILSQLVMFLLLVDPI